MLSGFLSAGMKQEKMTQTLRYMRLTAMYMNMKDALTIIARTILNTTGILTLKTMTVCLKMAVKFVNKSQMLTSM